MTVVRGYAAEKVHAPDVEFVENNEFEGTGELLSLHKARDRSRAMRSFPSATSFFANTF